MKKEPIVQLFLALVCLAAVISCSWQNNGNANVASNAEAPANANADANVGEPENGGRQSDAAEAETLVADIYKQHDSKKSPFFQTSDRSRVDRFFTKTTADLIWKDSGTKGEMGAIDFDPLYDAQDVEKKNFAVGRATVKGDTATVTATYTNYSEKKRITFVMKNVAGKWKIDDIKYDAGHALLALLQETYGGASPNAPPVKNVTNEFEGTYRVGDTTCTVRPDRQAFEVRWAKGKGSEYFFYKESTVFESEEDKSGGRNEFRFDDENYNTGTFYRADGKTFAVSRAK